MGSEVPTNLAYAYPTRCGVTARKYCLFHPFGGIPQNGAYSIDKEPGAITMLFVLFSIHLR